MFCWGAAAEVLTALEVRRKVCVAPLGLRALEVEAVSTHMLGARVVRRVG